MICTEPVSAPPPPPPKRLEPLACAQSEMSSNGMDPAMSIGNQPVR